MSPTLYFTAVLYGLLASTECLSCQTALDFNADGQSDTIKVDGTQFGEDGLLLSKTISVQLGGTSRTVHGIVQTVTGNLSAFPGSVPGELIVDYSNRTSRDSAELAYDVYAWSLSHQNFCLKASVTGTPPNQLQGEIIPSDVEVERFSGCTTLGETTVATPLTRSEVASIIIRELRKFPSDKAIPEYFAFELASAVDSSSVTMINNAAYFQEQGGFLAPALIILESVHAKFPRRAVATLNLADTYWKLGNWGKACRLYRQYHAALAPKGAGHIPERVQQRSACP